VHLVCSIVFDVLGLEPDATRGRIRLRPQLHRHDTLEARSIRFGDGSISMSAEHTDGTVVIRIAQDAGSIPVTALLEPIVDIFASAEVDGRAADLVPRTVADGVIVPVQLVLDGARTVVIRTE
jgi:hypothetical protein